MVHCRHRNECIYNRKHSLLYIFNHSRSESGRSGHSRRCRLRPRGDVQNDDDEDCVNDETNAHRPCRRCRCVGRRGGVVDDRDFCHSLSHSTTVYSQ